MDHSIPQIRAPALWQLSITGKEILVGVGDTGDTIHQDLPNVAARRDFTGAKSGVADKVGHGVAAESVIGGRGVASNGRYVGVAPDCRIAMAKVLGDDGSGTYDWIINGLEWLAKQGVKVINLSLGTDGPSDGKDPLAEEVNSLVKRGIVVVCAAGNAGPAEKTVGSPASAELCIAVAAVNDNNRVAYFSSRGPTADGRKKPDVAAPGVAIIMARAIGTKMGRVINDYYIEADGTSFAAPHVSGLVALLLQSFPGLSPIEINQALMQGAVPVRS